MKITILKQMQIIAKRLEAFCELGELRRLDLRGGITMSL